jgi:uncharacterized protein YndB with AHSA1/START domain
VRLTHTRRNGRRVACLSLGATTLALALQLSSPMVHAATGDDIRVEVAVDGDTIVVSVDCTVRASREQAWDVLTDFDHMARFMTHLESSSAERLGPWRIRVHQKGATGRGALQYAFDNVRVVDLWPYSRIEARFISRDLQASEYETELRESGGELHIVNRGRYIPGTFVPPFFGPLVIAAETRRQFAQIRDEISRRIAANHIGTPAP